MRALSPENATRAAAMAHRRRARELALFLAAAGAACPAAWAQTSGEQPALQLKSTRMLRDAISQGDRDAQPTFVYGDRISSRTSSSTSSLSGNSYIGLTAGKPASRIINAHVMGTGVRRF